MAGVLRTLSDIGPCKAMALPGRLLATYQLLPSFQYSEKLQCYVDSLENLDDNLPEPHPPPDKKADFFNRDDYYDVDRRAIETPLKYQTQTLEELVKYLTEGYSDDLSKIRVIYRWITCQPIDRLNLDKQPNQNQAVFQLWRIKNKKGNYAQLTSLLCRHAQIPCIIIHGILKGSTYEVGDVLEDDKHYGEWNAVLIDGHWRFINAYWGTCAEGVSETGNCAARDNDVMDDGRLVYTCDENYFLTDPDQIAATHLPHVEKWQLKASPVSKEEFQEMTFVKDRYFNLGMKTMTHHRCVIKSDTGDVEIKFSLPQNKALDIDFQYLFFKKVGANWTRADRYVFIHRTNNYDFLTIKIRSPVAATYRFELVGKDITVEEDGYDYDWIALYKLVFSAGVPDCSPYPPTPSIGWGPGQSAMTAGIVPLSHFTGEVLMDDYGRAEIKFGASDQSRIGGMMYAALLYKAGNDVKELPDHVVHRLENGDVIFNVQTPDKGEYMLRLFFRREGDVGNGEELCDYFLISNQMEKNGKFPKGFQNRLGAKMPAFAASGLRPLKTSGYVRADTEKVKFGFIRDEDIELSVNLSGDKINPADAPKLLSQSEKDDLVEYTVRLPETGQYGVRIRGTTTDGGVHAPLYDYVVDYRKPRKREQGEMSIKDEAENFDKTEADTEDKMDAASTDTEENGTETATFTDKDIEKIIENGDLNDEGTEHANEPEEDEDATKPDVLRRRVRMAVEEQNASELKRALDAMKALELVSLNTDIEHAEKELSFLTVKKALLIAIRDKDYDKLRASLKKARDPKIKPRLEQEIALALQLIERLKKLRKLLHAIMALDQSTISEIRSYTTPPPVVHTVMMATLLLLGKWEHETRKWTNIQIFIGKIGKESLKRMISDFKIEKCPLEVAMGAKDYLRDYSIDQVRLVSAGCATFYVWVKGVIEELENRVGDDINKIRPKTTRSKKKSKERELTFLDDVTTPLD